MFISVTQLERDMGVNKIIGRFFVDRKPPEDNSFWKNRLLYIGFGNGFVSIPVFYDILFRIGIPLETLLDEKHILFMERLMHYAIQQERKEITKKEELQSVRNMLQGRVRDQNFYMSLNEYLDQPVLRTKGFFGTGFPSLNRADVFLYVLCDLPLTDAQWQLAIRYWYALHPTYLILDDIRDYGEDKENGEENVVLELGEGAAGFEKSFDMIRTNSDVMEEINPAQADFMRSYEGDMKRFVPVNF